MEKKMNKLVTLSRMPPCPGKIDPESLIPEARLMNDSSKSPYTDTTDPMNPIAI